MTARSSSAPSSSRRPTAPNPIVACANSSWFFWVATNAQFLGPYDPTNDQTFIPTEMLEGEAVVTTPEADHVG